IGDEGNRPVAGNELPQAVEAAAFPVDAGGGERCAVGVDRYSVGHVPVERLPLGVETAEIVFVLRERPVGAANPAPGRVDVDVTEDDEVVREPRACLGARHGTAAERDHRRVRRGERDADGMLLDPPELGLAALGEELGDRLAGALLDRRVEIEEGTVEPLGELAPERGLARAHEADEDDVAAERVQCQPTRSTYARHAATKSPTASPPNFSCAARASSHATAASATTASASTAATSERSTSACAASP